MTASVFAPTPDPFELAARMFEPAPVSPYLNDPVGWVRDTLGETLWSKQREIAESVRDHRRTAVKSCHDAGKVSSPPGSRRGSSQFTRPVRHL